MPATIWNVFGFWVKNSKVATVKLQFHGCGFKVKGGLLLILPCLSLTEQRTAATPTSFAVVWAGDYSEALFAMKRDGNSALTPSFQHTKAARGTEFRGNQSVTPLAPARDISIRKAACRTLLRESEAWIILLSVRINKCAGFAQAFTQVYMHLLLNLPKQDAQEISPILHRHIL